MFDDDTTKLYFLLEIVNHWLKNIRLFIPLKKKKSSVVSFIILTNISTFFLNIRKKTKLFFITKKFKTKSIFTNMFVKLFKTLTITKLFKIKKVKINILTFSLRFC